MELKEISLAQLLNNTSGTDYFAVFAKLIGHSNNSVFYDGVNDDDYYLLEELEEKLGYELPSHYLDFLSYLNGGKLFNIDLFSLTEKEYPNSLYFRNFGTDIRKQLELDDSVLIIGKYENYILYVDCIDLDGSYTLMDIRNNEKIDFQSFSALIGFIFYILVLKTNKKLEEEKEQIKEMKEKLHNEFKKRNKEIKSEKEKINKKIKAKALKKALKEQVKKNNRQKNI